MGVMESFSLAGKVALVTGGAGLYGRQIVAALAEAGARTFIAARDVAKLEAVAAEERSRGFDVTALSLDLSSDKSIEALHQTVIARSGRCDVLVNNAVTRSALSGWAHDLEAFDKSLRVNASALFKITHLFGQTMRQQKAGSVINIGSIDGLKSSIFDAFSYGASKAAVHHLTRFMATHLTGEKILFNAIAPGPFPTWMLSTGVGFGGETENVDWDTVGSRNPSKRVGTPQDIAGLAIFLCSRAGEYVVGQTIACDGGIVGTA